MNAPEYWWLVEIVVGCADGVHAALRAAWLLTRPRGSPWIDWAGPAPTLRGRHANVPADIRTALGGNYTDMRFRVELNRPYNVQGQYLFDRFTFGPLCTPQSDNNPCTTDTCDANGQQVHTPVAAGTSCADASACNGAETCDAAGTCTAGTPVSCVASDQCHDAGTCDPATGACTTPTKPDGTSCADATACNGSETCQSGSCTPGTPPTVDDGNPCTTDSCDPATAVTHTPVAAGTSCADANACNGAETCDESGTCSSGRPVTCAALDQCHDVGTCDPATGLCSNPAKADGVACTDGNACTVGETCQNAACATFTVATSLGSA